MSEWAVYICSKNGYHTTNCGLHGLLRHKKSAHFSAGHEHRDATEHEIALAVLLGYDGNEVLEKLYKVDEVGNMEVGRWTKSRLSRNSE